MSERVFRLQQEEWTNFMVRCGRYERIHRTESIKYPSGLFEQQVPPCRGVRNLQDHPVWDKSNWIGIFSWAKKKS